MLYHIADISGISRKRILNDSLFEDEFSHKYNVTIQIVKVWLPLATGVMLPLCFMNLYTLLFRCGNILKFPSFFLYANIVILDIFNGLVAILVYHDHLRLKDKSVWHKVASKIYLISFDAGIVLICGLAAIRCVWVTVNPIRIIGNIRSLAYALAAVAWLFGGFAVVYPSIIRLRLGKGAHIKYYPYFVFFDMGECMVLILALILSLYTNIRLRTSKLYRSHQNYKTASRTTLALTVNFTLSYLYYLFLNIERLVYVSKCPPADSWIKVLVFQMSIEIGVSCMLLQGIATGIILLTMRNIRYGLFYRTQQMYRKLHLTSGYQQLHNQL